MMLIPVIYLVYMGYNRGYNFIKKTFICMKNFFSFTNNVDLDKRQHKNGRNMLHFIWLSYCPLQILPLKNCSQDTCISKTITASSLKLCQLIEDNEWSSLFVKVPV